MKHYNFDEIIDRKGTSCVGKRKSDTFMGSGYGFRNSGFYCRSLEETL